MKLLFATTNPGKLKELRDLVGEALEVVSAADLGALPEVVEDQPTYEGNALKKARELGQLTGLAALADDSGLSVDALDGRPGVLSARYAPDAESRIVKMLGELEGVPLDRRTARFSCALVLWVPGGKTTTTQGVCEGRICFAPRGEHGFGYDPIFEVAANWRTMAELTLAEKASVSHRCKAFAAMKPHLLGLAFTSAGGA